MPFSFNKLRVGSTSRGAKFPSHYSNFLNDNFEFSKIISLEENFMNKVAVVTGSYRGLGFGTVEALAKKDYKVILTARKTKEGESSAERLKQTGLDVEFEKLDVLDEKNIQDFSERVLKKYGKVDVLVNNAGIFEDDRNSQAILDSFKTNTLGAFLLIESFLPSMKKNNFGRIVNISSGMGALHEMNGGYPAYRISKTALNAVTALLADENKDRNILINSVCPGWVKTEMGGSGAPRSIEEGISGIVWAATLPDDGPTGGFFRDSERIDW
jgi:NAD(P)-dependent dehydrogenase (short-subunit alcohol dehydrogenase family)